MRKIIAGIALFSILGLAIAPAVALADIESELGNTCRAAKAKARLTTECPTALPDVCNVETDANCAFCCVMNTVYNVTDWIFYILLAAVTLMIIYGALLYVTAAGDPEKAGKGKAVLTYALIGFAIAMLAKILPAFIKYFIGVSSTTPTPTPTP